MPRNDSVHKKSAINTLIIKCHYAKLSVFSAMLNVIILMGAFLMLGDILRSTLN